jgi:hypothetical protein
MIKPFNLMFLPLVTSVKKFIPQVIVPLSFTAAVRATAFFAP